MLSLPQASAWDAHRPPPAAVCTWMFLLLLLELCAGEAGGTAPVVSVSLCVRRGGCGDSGGDPSETAGAIQLRNAIPLSVAWVSSVFYNMGMLAWTDTNTEQKP
ncbi:hypothetical protein QTO34_010069 [Cnephaeus nilssonii]|uniref:Uncharacterized protein n=1 Tax=Cnephaeus nilssonii TaxID=3371016 RepID=A0AA40HFT2_CNENI|nr:hypothetical protein QTO34_010069 [Eptesicus nilssonii]